MSSHRSPAGLLLLALAIGMAAGCGGSTSPATGASPAATPGTSAGASTGASPGPAGGAGPTASATPTSAGASTAAAGAIPAGGSAGASPAGPGRCHTAGLAVTVRDLSPGAGQRYAALVLTNRSGADCTSYGYVGMQLLDANRRPVPTNLVRDRTPAPRSVLLLPGASAWTLLHWTVVPGAHESGRRCEPTPAYAEVTPPDETTQLVAAWLGGSVCQSGRIDTTALAAGTGPAS